MPKHDNHELRNYWDEKSSWELGREEYYPPKRIHTDLIWREIQLSYIDKIWLYHNLGVTIDRNETGDFIHRWYRIMFGENNIGIDFKHTIEYGRVNGRNLKTYTDEEKLGDNKDKALENARIKIAKDFGDELKKLCIEPKVFSEISL